MKKIKFAVTMSDVARAAGVSTATVSRVVNGHYGVSESTVEHVRATIEELGYESSLVATSLRRSRTNVLGLVAHSFESYTAEVLKDIAGRSPGRVSRSTPRSSAGETSSPRRRRHWPARYSTRLTARPRSSRQVTAWP